MLISPLLIKLYLPEIKESLEGGKLLFICHQPDAKEIILAFRTASQTVGLLFNYHAQEYHFRILSQAQIRKLDYPRTDQLFSPLSDGELEEVSQIDFDRILKFTIIHLDQLSGKREFHLYCEVTANFNLILTDGHDQILEALKASSSTSTAFRAIQPGAKYVLPKLPARANPLEITEAQWQDLAEEKKTQSWLEFVSKNFLGIDASLAREILRRAKVPTGEQVSSASESLAPKVFRTFKSIFTDSFTVQPVVVSDEAGLPLAVLPFDYEHIPKSQKETYPSFNQAWNALAEKRREILHLRNLKDERQRQLAKLQNKLKESLVRAESEIEEKKGHQTYKEWADLLMINKDKIKKGSEQAVLPDLYSSSQKDIAIALNPERSVVQNAQDYYKKFQKAKTGILLLEERRRKLSGQLTGLESTASQLEMAKTEKDLHAVEDTFRKLGVLPRKAVKQLKKRKGEKKHFRTFQTSSGWTVLVGRSNLENETLSFKTAKPEDLWFHASGQPGSHVVLVRPAKNKEPNFEAIAEAASLAAYFSKARHSKKVEVVYTLAKHVRKPKAGKAGLALVTKEKSILVEPKLPAREDDGLEA